MLALSLITQAIYHIAKLAVFIIIAVIGIARLSFDISLHVIKLLDSKK
jgi:hypothetical protein